MDDGGLLSYNKDYRSDIPDWQIFDLLPTYKSSICMMFGMFGLVFNTQGFSFQEVEILSQNLNHSYNLTTWVKENKKKPIIAVWQIF